MFKISQKNKLKEYKIFNSLNITVWRDLFIDKLII